MYILSNESIHNILSLQLNLALGDPTIHGPHLKCPDILVEAVESVLRSVF